MDNPRPEKVAVVADVRQRLDDTEAVVLTEYRGLDVAEMAQLRTSLREVGGEYRIYKNTLVRFAARELGLEIEELLTGPTAIAFVGERPDGTRGDPVGLAKALREFARDNDKLVIKGGLLGDQVVTAADVDALSKIAPREQLLAELAGAMESILADFAGLLDAKLREFAYAMDELADKGVLAAGTAAAEPSEPAETEAVADTAAEQTENDTEEG